MGIFLEKLAEELYSKYGDGISRMCVVFPSRRAGLFFKQHLSKNLNQPLWLPAVFSIQDFIVKLSPLPLSDKLTLIFELYETYRQFSPEESFDKFYPWGDMLLNDFDDIDKNIVETDYLFRILREHKEVESDFELKVSDIEEFYKFWRSFSGKELTEMQDNFINTWEVIGKVYHSFRKKLAEKNICYEGMAYRQIYELTGAKKLKHDWEKIIFAGFNALNTAEEGIIKGLLNQGAAETFWDADEYYLKSEIQEAGYFLRRNFVNLGINNAKWREDNLLAGKKNIKIIGTPLKVSQAKVLGNELKNISSASLDKTAIVLPDDSLMIPVLYSLPENISALNITMGFPFKDSSLYNLLQLLKSLQSGKKGSGKSAAYYHKDVVQLLLHPYVKFTGPYEIYELVNQIKRRNMIYISRKRILEAFSVQPEIITEIFTDIDTPVKSLGYIYNIITIISKQLESSKSNTAFEMEYLFKLYTELNHLSAVLKKYSAEMDNDTFWKLIIEVASSIKIPFTGEPLKGLQVMGLLETRLLDFENVYILSMNEGTMPRGNTHGSFIPYSLRRAFKMPTYEDDDSNAAYYFYRLLQRAENVTLIYNTEPGELTAGEKSRFIMQVEQELAVENKNIKLQNFILQADVEIPKRKEIIIPKSADILEALKNESHFSATRLAMYINCPLQFYLRTIAKLKEEEEVEEFFSGGGFGTILHEIMDMLYSDCVGKTVDEKIILSLKDWLNNDYDDIWKNACGKIPEYEEFKAEIQGKNLLYKNIIKKLIEKILDNDETEVPFKIVSLEHEITKEMIINASGNEYKIKLLGRLDRVEEKDGVKRIVDYKTGSVTMKKQNSKRTDAEHIQALFNSPDYKENFQQLFYASLYLESSANSKLIVGIYPLRNINDGIFWFEEAPISTEKSILFRGKLQELLVKIFDSTTPFNQTDEIERCKYCAYNSICYRD